MNVARSDLCRSCGLCCTGALYSHVGLEAAEAEQLSRAGGTVAYEDGRAHMEQPCRHHCSASGCSIYERRYAACRQFRCALLVKVEDGQIGEEAARRTISTAKQLLEAAGPLALTRTGRSAIRSAPLFENEPVDEAARRALTLERLRLVALDRYLDRNFRRGEASAEE